jgi:hypothetical protein
MQAELPALEGTTCSEAFSKHLNVLHETRKAYTAAVHNRTFKMDVISHFPMFTAVSFSKSIFTPAFFIADRENSRGISDSTTSVLTRTCYYM